LGNKQRTSWGIGCRNRRSVQMDAFRQWTTHLLGDRLQKPRVSADGRIQAMDNAQAGGSVAETEGQCRWSHSGNVQRTCWGIGCRNPGSVQLLAFRQWSTHLLRDRLQKRRSVQMDAFRQWTTHRLRDRLQKPRLSVDRRLHAMDNAQAGGSIAETEGQCRWTRLGNGQRTA
jgi:hypothetical protein